MADDYEYFSEEEPSIPRKNYSNNNSNNDDEQHQQKVNGRVEKLEAQVHHLKAENARLVAENEHLLAQHHYKHAPHSHVDDVLPANEGHVFSDHDHMAKELHKNKVLVTELKAQLAEAEKPRVPIKLFDAFMKYSLDLHLPVDLGEKHHQNMEGLISVLKISQQRIFTMKKQIDDAVPQGSDAELSAKVKNLQDELLVALNAANDIRALRGKLTQMIERVRIEKESKLKADMECANFRKKTEMLGDHMEKLMAHLRHESSTKLRLIKQLHDNEDLNRQLKENYSVLLKKNAAKDRFILEMHEGSKVLEDQLRLMDEKYLDLRSKLDFAREFAAKKLSKAQKEASSLRAKFTMLTGNSTQLLDNIRLPNFVSGENDAYSLQSSASFDSHRSISSSNSRTASKATKLKPILKQTEVQQEANLEQVLEKINRKATVGQAKEWTHDEMRSLVKSTH